jgi:mannose-1-phosphate guanylyltransferase
MADAEILAVILSGGSGTRFWPLSKKALPKQYLSLFGPRSLVQQTADRLAGVVAPNNLYTISTESQKKLLEAQLPEIKHHLFEPEGKNTAPCLMLTAAELLSRKVSPDSVLTVLPADHHISDPDAFRAYLKKAASFAREHEALVTFGIQPNCPHTGYGYIEAGDKSGSSGLHKVRRFVEKPDQKKAEGFLASGNFYWNSGMFVWRLRAIVNAFEKYLGDDWSRLLAASSGAERTKVYRSLKAAPIDTAVLEKADNVFVLPASMGWSDVGSWGALYELRNKDAAKNTSVSGQMHSVESRGCLVSVPEGKKVALVGVEDLIVVESDGHLLICRRDKDQLVREAAKILDV